MFVVEEKDESGKLIETCTIGSGQIVRGAAQSASIRHVQSAMASTGIVRSQSCMHSRSQGLYVAVRKQGLISRITRVLEDVFLPAGYPNSVSVDYFQYQVYNALQAYFSSLASLIASRAVLEGHGVGDPTASATDAMILTIIQEAFSRVTTILGAYYFGTSLFPEAKTYRFLADLLNDTAIVLDSISPLLASGTKFSVVFPGSSLRVASLCLSGACRALCGVVAGGSKTALTIHFAEDGRIPGDIGDLNAKDGSRETVLSLLGMLSGTLVLRYLSTATTTYIVLFLLIASHLAANYIAVCAVSQSTLNRQRAGIAWLAFYKSYCDAFFAPFMRAGDAQESDDAEASSAKTRAPSPEWVSSREQILVRSGMIKTRDGSRVVGCVSFESSLASFLLGRSSSGTGSGFAKHVESVLNLYANEKYVLITDSAEVSSTMPLRTWIFLKDGYGPLDRLKAWVHAVEVGARWKTGVPALEVIEAAYRTVDDAFPIFMEKLKEAGWNVDEGLVVSSPLRTLAVSEGENKKES